MFPTLSELLGGSPEFQLLLRALRGERALGEGIGEKGNCSWVTRLTTRGPGAYKPRAFA